jgi:hypothetical protein
VFGVFGGSHDRTKKVATEHAEHTEEEEDGCLRPGVRLGGGKPRPYMGSKASGFGPSAQSAADRQPSTMGIALSPQLFLSVPSGIGTG